jgi:pyridoxine kinase
VLVTSVLLADRAPDTLDVLAVSDAGAWAVTTPMLALSPNGGGDVTAALYLAHLLESRAPATALARTTSSVFAILEATLAAESRELRIVDAQDAIAHPADRFEVRQLR